MYTEKYKNMFSFNVINYFDFAIYKVNDLKVMFC